MATNDFNERVATVQFHGGGDMTLTASTKPKLEELRTGEWIMLAQTDLVRNSHVFKWYRVVASDPEVAGGGPYTRAVTVQGPDWNGGIATQATLVKGAVAVYEKTIRLDTSSLWGID